MGQDRLAAFEPAFADELAVIMRWGFDYMQRGRSGRGGAGIGARAFPETKRAARCTFA